MSEKLNGLRFKDIDGDSFFIIKDDERKRLYVECSSFDGDNVLSSSGNYLNKENARKLIEFL